MRQLLIITLIVLLLTISLGHAQGSDLPPCSETELAGIHSIMPGIEELFGMAADVHTLDDLTVYGQAQITWRGQLWIITPPCSEAYKMALLANQLTTDYLASLLVNARKESADVNPYQAWQFEGAARFEALWNALPPPDQRNEKVANERSARMLRACTESERGEVLDTLLPEYDSLTDIANAVETFDDFLGFIEALLNWREISLTSYPPCAESIEIAWLASQTASDISALFAFHFVGVPVDDIPYSEPERQGTRRLGELDAILRSSPESEADPADLPVEVRQAIERELGNPSGGNWRRCTIDELETIQNLLPTYQSLEDMAAGIETLGDLAAYSETQIAWRENLLTKLARCGEVLEIAWLISENIGDLAIMHGLKLIDIPVDESPVFQQVMSNVPGIDTWEGLLPSLLESYEQRDDIGPLPACTEEELGALKSILFAHLSIFKEYGDIYTTDDLLNFILRQIAWREVGFSQLPLCYGSFETFLRAHWYISDNAVGIALALAGVSDEANPYPEQQSIGKSHIERWYAIVEGVAAAPSADGVSGSSES